ncbi:MAG: hypothetical protein AAB601_02545 [Patescibacteria group bacterium]
MLEHLSERNLLPFGLRDTEGIAVRRIALLSRIRLADRAELGMNPHYFPLLKIALAVRALLWNFADG